MESIISFKFSVVIVTSIIISSKPRSMYNVHRCKPDPLVLSQLHNSASGAMMMGLELVKTAAGGGGDKPGQWRGPLVSIMCPGHCAAKPLCQPEKHDID